jgi:glycosyltransferase involved in cell wall biosynthesis
MKPLGVVHIISALPVGGVERNLAQVLPRFDPRAFRTSVVCTRERGALAADLEAAGVPVRLVPFRTRYDPASLWRLRRHLRAEGAEIVHAHMRRANTSGRIGAMLAGVPVRIATEHDLGLGKRPVHYRVDRWLGARSDVVLCVSDAVSEWNRERSGLPAETFRTSRPGIDLAPFRDPPPRGEARRALAIPEDAPVAGFVGRLHAVKNVDAILRAFADPRLAETHLAVAGDGREAEALRALAEALGLAERVHFLGMRPDMPAVYAALDACVLASTSEGHGLVPVEALAAGVPLVSTPVGVVAEAFRAGRDHIPVAAPDPALLAEGLLAALEPARAEALRRAGRETAERFGLDRQVAEWSALYRELAARRGLR